MLGIFSCGTMGTMTATRQTPQPDLSLIEAAQAAIKAEEEAHKKRMWELRLDLGRAIKITRETKRAKQNAIADHLKITRDTARLIQRDAEDADAQ